MNQELTVKEGREVGARYPWALSGQPQCGAVVKGKIKGLRYRVTCTRPAHTSGPHVAHVPGGTALATWE